MNDCAECGIKWLEASEHLVGDNPEDGEWFCSLDCKLDLIYIVILNMGGENENEIT